MFTIKKGNGDLEARKTALGRFGRKADIANAAAYSATLGYSSPVRFLENWISQHVNQQPEAA